MDMAPTLFYFIFFFILSFRSLHSAQQPKPQCPSCFTCRNLGEFGFPFSNTSNPDCGFYVNCTDEQDPKVQFHKQHRWYNVENISRSDKKILILDEYLLEQLESNRCDSLTNFSVPVFPSVKFYDKSLEFPFFKCKREKSRASHQEFFQSLYNHTGCTDDYDLYFTGGLEKSLKPLPETFYDLCSTVLLPVPWSVDPFKPATWWDPTIPAKDLTYLWAAKYSLSWDTPPDCDKCLKEGGSKNKIKIVIALTTIGASAAVTIAIVCYLTRKSISVKFMVFSKKQNKNVQKVEAFLMNYGSLSPRRYRYADIKNMTNSFKHKLGQGGYGSVFKGRLLDGRMIAVKLLSESKGNGEEFINEVASISRTSHINVVTLIGFCVEGNKRALIYEFMPNGSLEKFIYDQINPHPLGWKTLYEIVLGIAQGLEYLHRGCNTRILHFDIKPHNILLDQDFCPKISDFGLSKLCLAKESIVSMTGARGTAGYIAPELISRNFGAISHKSDVYSYGMMVLEIVGGRKNVDARAADSSKIYFPQWVYNHLDQPMDLGLKGVTTAEDEEISRKMVLVGLWCIQIDPSNRPPMNKVLDMLVGSLEELQIPPKPFLSSPPRPQENLSIISISSFPRPR